MGKRIFTKTDWRVVFCTAMLCVFGYNNLKAQHGMPLHIHDGCCKGGHVSHKGIASQTPLLHNYDVLFYHLDIAVERTSVDVEGHVRIVAKVVGSQLDTFAFELVPELLIDSILINGVGAIFTRVGDEVFAEVPNALSQGDVFDVVVYYGGTPLGGGFFSGISTGVSPSWGNQITWTLSEPFNAKMWFPVKQVLGDKADSVYVYVTTDASNKVGSNGLLKGIDTLANNKVRYKWESRYPIAYYLISIAVGEYVDYSFYAHPAGLNDSILIQNYIYDNPGTLPFFKQQIDLTKDFMELFSDIYTLYPFWEEKYGHCMAPFNGGMEHQTMTTQGSFNFTLTAHELGHQWFGNNVTCATWNDIWINEGFASYSEYLALQFINSGSEVQWLTDAHNFIKSFPGGSVYVPLTESNNVNRIFDSRLSYKKGAAIVHMIRHELQNDSVFFDVLKTFQAVYKDSVASGDDFREVLETVSGKNFVNYFDQWYYGEGYPIFDIVWKQQDDSLFFTVHQTTSTPATPFFNVLLPFMINTINGDTLVLMEQTQATQSFSIPFTAQVQTLFFDKGNAILKSLNSLIQHISVPEAPMMFSLFPNPVSTELTLLFGDNSLKQIRIFDLAGRCVSDFESKDAATHINVSFMNEGIYFIVVCNKDGICVREKFIKL